ncbi:MAG TPA: hypothetical protein VGI47_09465 [Candidatus Binataceae bacterium]
MLRAKLTSSRWLAFVTGLALVGCSSGSGTIETGMTPDQTVTALGHPDLTDSVPDPAHSGGTVLRYTWVGAGKAATFSPDSRVAKIDEVQPNSAPGQQAAASQASAPFDPISTPVSYAFYPIRAMFIYLGAGLNCAVGAPCIKPALPPVASGG